MKESLSRIDTKIKKQEKKLLYVSSDDWLKESAKLDKLKTAKKSLINNNKFKVLHEKGTKSEKLKISIEKQREKLRNASGMDYHNEARKLDILEEKYQILRIDIARRTVTQPKIPTSKKKSIKTKKNSNQISTSIHGKTITQAELKRRRTERLAKKETDNSLNIERVNWTLLPVGTDWATFEINFNEQIAKSGGNFEQKAIDEAKDRFKCIFELRPKSIYRGFETFSDYFALLFEDTDKVVLESVNYGNAIYIIKGDWKIQSRRTKAELKTSNKTKVIHHRSDWFSKLKNYLQIGFE